MTNSKNGFINGYKTNIILEVQKNQNWKGQKFKLNFKTNYIYLLKIHVFAETPNTLLEVIYHALNKDNLVATFVLNKKENDFEFLFTPFSNSQNLEFRMSTYDGYSPGKMYITVIDVLTIKTDVNGTELQKSIQLVGPWFHQLNLRGLMTRNISKAVLNPCKVPIDDFTETDHDNHPWSIWNQFKHLIPKNLKGKKVLDIACSDGFYSIEFAKRGANVIGFDNWYPNIVRAIFAKKVLDIKNISFYYLDANDLHNTFQTTFDIVLCLGLLYHLKDPQKIINEIAKCTKLAYFETIVDKDVQESKLIENNEITDDGFIPTISWLFDAFKKAGFSKIDYVNPHFHRPVFRVGK